MGLAREAESSLAITAPADGIVLTQKPAALLGQDVASGQPLLDLADAGPRMVRVYIPVSTLDRISADAEVALALPGNFSIVRMPLAPPGGDAVSLPQGLVHSQEYKAHRACLSSTAPRSRCRPRRAIRSFGMAGEAKIFGKRRSLVQSFATSVYDLAKAHLW